MEGQRRRTITFVWLLPAVQRKSRLWSRPKRRPFLMETESLLFAGSKLLSHPLTPELFYHCLVLAGGSCRGTVITRWAQALTFPQLVKVAIGSFCCQWVIKGLFENSCWRQCTATSIHPSWEVRRKKKKKKNSEMLMILSSTWATWRSQSSQRCYVIKMGLFFDRIFRRFWKG